MEEDIKRIVAQQLRVELDTIEDRSSFMDDLGADSLALVELMLALEEQLSLEIVDWQTDKIRTVGDAIAHLSTQRKVS